MASASDKVIVHLTSLSDGFPLERFTNCYYFSNDSASVMSSVASNTVDEVRCIGFTPDAEMCEEIFRVLVSKGKCGLERCIPTREAGQDACLDLKIAGFVDVMSIKDPSTGERFVVSQKPNCDMATTAAIKLPPKSASSSANDEDEELIDENALLAGESTNVQRAVRGDVGGCGVDAEGGVIAGRRRACKNCSCGLAEMEDEQDAKESGAAAVRLMGEEEKIAKASACGGCSRGDAFRCASCPFLGKPAFEPGQERVVLQLDDDI